MGSSNIQAKIKRGLAKAIAKTGSSTSELVYLVSKTVTGGDTPLSPATETETKILLPNAIFQTLDAKLFAGDILATDRQLVSDNTVVIQQGDIIEEGTTRYMVMEQDVKAPTSDVLAYISLLRAQ
jgi:hypothetical protein